GSADLDGDGFKLRLGLVGRILVSHSPARRFGGGAQPGPQGYGVEFDDRAIGFITEVVTDPVEFFDGRKQLLHGAAEPDFLRRLETERFQPGEQIDLRPWRLTAFYTSGAVEHDVELSLRHNLWVQLFERPGGGIARVDERLLAGGPTFGVDFREHLLGEVNLASHFQQ